MLQLLWLLGLQMVYSAIMEAAPSHPLSLPKPIKTIN